MLIIASSEEPGRFAQKKKAHQGRLGSNPRRGTQDATLRRQAGRITDFVLEKLQPTVTLSSGISSSISPSAYLALLPTIWTLINNNFGSLKSGSGPADDQRQRAAENNEVLGLVLDHATKLSSKAASKPLTVEFVARLVLVRVLTGFN